MPTRYKMGMSTPGVEQLDTAGGQVSGEPMDIPGVGKYISFKDSEDNLVGMLQPSQMS